MRGNEINWNRLFYFCEIARENSLTAAAKQLSLTPSTLSEHLSGLEEDLRVALFYRDHRKLRLTPEGTNLYQHVRPLFETGQRLMDVVSPLPMGGYPVTVGIIPGSTRMIGGSLLVEYAREFGPLNLNFSQTTQELLERGLLSAQFDFGLAHRVSERTDIVSSLISSSPVRLFVARRLSGRRVEELFETLPILCWKEDTAIGSSLDTFLNERDFHPVSTINAEDMWTLHQFCAVGLGVAALSEAFIEKMGNHLVPAKLKDHRPIRMEETYVSWFQGAENTAVIQHLRKILQSKGYRSENNKKEIRRRTISSKRTLGSGLAA
ncbi:MAG TPA: LysR family transcriptional regulator [Bdellovibrionota bacterium]|nr:LysR family transcriptional regulator [Bdellovibrionota bacterium]